MIVPRGTIRATLLLAGLLLTFTPTASARPLPNYPVFFTETPSGQFAVQCFVNYFALYSSTVLTCDNAAGNAVLMASHTKPHGYKTIDASALPNTQGRLLKPGSAWLRAGLFCTVGRYIVDCFSLVPGFNSEFEIDRSTYVLHHP